MKRLSIYAIALAVTVLAVGCGDSSGGHSSHVDRGTDRAKSVFPKANPVADETDGLFKAADDAEKNGRYGVAEAKYSVILRKNPKNLLADLFLARLYDRERRDREAFESYHALFHTPGTRSTAERDPRALARYGDLCAKFGEPTESQAAFQNACQSYRPSRNENAPTLPLDESSSVRLRASAYACAGVADLGYGNAPEAAKELATAVVGNPSAWPYRFYYALALSDSGQRMASKEQFKKLESLTTGNLRDWIHKMRRLLGLSDDQTFVRSEGGHTTVTSVRKP